MDGLYLYLSWVALIYIFCSNDLSSIWLIPGACYQLHRKKWKSIILVTSLLVYSCQHVPDEFLFQIRSCRQKHLAKVQPQPEDSGPKWILFTLLKSLELGGVEVFAGTSRPHEGQPPPAQDNQVLLVGWGRSRGGCFCCWIAAAHQQTWNQEFLKGCSSENLEVLHQQASPHLIGALSPESGHGRPQSQ